MRRLALALITITLCGSAAACLQVQTWKYSKLELSQSNAQIAINAANKYQYRSLAPGKGVVSVCMVSGEAVALGEAKANPEMICGTVVEMRDPELSHCYRYADMQFVVAPTPQMQSATGPLHGGPKCLATR